MVILTNENYKDEVLNYKGKVVIDFWATWCGPCKMAKPMFEAKEKEINNIKFCEANIDEATDFTSEMKISNVPTFGMFENGKEIWRGGINKLQEIK